MADRVVVMSSRPGRIKWQLDIRFESRTRPTPLQARALPEFNDYFRKIRDELWRLQQQMGAAAGPTCALLLLAI